MTALWCAHDDTRGVAHFGKVTFTFPVPHQTGILQKFSPDLALLRKSPDVKVPPYVKVGGHFYVKVTPHPRTKNQKNPQKEKFTGNPLGRFAQSTLT